MLSNRLKILICFGLFAAGLFFNLNFSFAQNRDQKNFRAGEFLIKFKGQNEILKIKVDYQSDVNSLIETYSKRNEVEFIEPNFLLQVSGFPNDPDYSKQTYLIPINARFAWSKELLARETEKITNRSVIAILDTGVDLDHPDLKDKIWTNIGERANDGVDNDRNGYIDDINGWDFVDSDADPNPQVGAGFDFGAVNHGTIVSGIAAAATNNQEGISGLSWFSEIMPLRILDSSGSGDVFSAIRAIDYAIGNGADVINMSFVGTNNSKSLEAAIERAYNQNIVVVAAAGNTDPKIDGVNLDLNKYYPVCNDGSTNMVIGVASVDASFRKSRFSNYGGCVDIVAPGEKFYSTQVYDSNLSDFKDYYNGYWSGTSLSAPLVSATVGIIKALRPQYNPTVIRDLIMSSAQDIDIYNKDFSGLLGAGQLDVQAALEKALGQELPVVQIGKNSYFVAGLGLGSFPQLKVLDRDGNVFKEFFAYSHNFGGAIKVAIGDVNGDGQQEIVTGTGTGGGPHVRVFNIEGQVLSQFFAYDQNSRGGVNLAVADTNKDGVDEIITGSGQGLEPEVKIFDYHGNLKNKFLAYDSKFRGDVKVGIGDVNGDGQQEIVTGAGAGGGPHVRIFDLQGSLVSQFFAYNQNFRGGVNIAIGDIHGDRQAEIIATVENNSLPTVRVFDYRGQQLVNFFAFEPNFLAGVEIATGDYNNDGIDEIITGRGIGGNAQIRVFDYSGKLELDFSAYNLNYQGGVRPVIIRL